MILQTAGSVVLVIGLAASGCQNQAGPDSLPDGVTKISKNMRGSWTAPGGPGCTWAKYTSPGKKDGGTKTASGSGTRSQFVNIYSADVGGELRSDKCGGWNR